MFGSLNIIYGSMFSGKTTELLRQIERVELLNKPFLVFSSHLDNRYGTNILSSHTKITYPCNPIKSLHEIIQHKDYNNTKYIFIDEFQFFVNTTPIYLMLNKDHKHIFLSGLIIDKDLNYFGDLYKFIPVADNITHLKALCIECGDGTEAIFTKQINNKKDNQVIDVGNKDKYISVCRKHYLT